jgi:hypothetical protein
VGERERKKARHSQESESIGERQQVSEREGGPEFVLALDREVERAAEAHRTRERE